MKKLLLLFCLLTTCIAQAQIVNIPDPAFKSQLVNALVPLASGFYGPIDANDDGEIQIDEAVQVVEFSYQIGGDEVMSFEGIDAFVNLTALSFVNNNITTIDFNLPNVELLGISGCANLTTLDCSGFPGVIEIELMDVPNLSTVLFEGALSLERYESINSSTPAVFDLTTAPSLTSLHLTGASQLASLVIDGHPNLQEIYVLTDNPNYTAFNPGYLPALTQLGVSNYYFQSADLSGCVALDYLDFGGQNLRSLNLKNGDNVYDFCNVTVYPLGSYICVDEGEEVYMEPIIANNTNVVVNTYCSYFPGGSYNTIAGTARFDADDGECGEGDPANAFLKVSIDNGAESQIAFTNMQGAYAFYTQEGIYTLTPQTENGEWFTISPATASVEWASVEDGESVQDFCITANGVHQDAEVTLTPLVPARPGFDAQYGITYTNNGNQVLSGTVTLDFNDEQMDYIYASQSEISMVAGSFYTTITWEFEDLQPFETRVIGVTMNINGPMDTPAISIGDYLGFASNLMHNGTDETPPNNHSELKQVVVGSFDPNDITCIEGAIVDPLQIGEYLHYNINFENTGDYPAEFIVVKQVIDADMYDINSLEMLYASHGVMAKVEGDKVEYRFDAINLDPQEKGNVVYKIKTIATLQEGDGIMSKAEIFFDYNWPIVTNEAVTEFITEEEIITIPDANFKFLLVSAGNVSYPEMAKDNEGNFMVIDANGDGEIQVSEAEAVWEIFINYEDAGISVTSMEGVQYFTNLRKLAAYNGDVSVLPLEGLTHMEELMVVGNSLITLDTSGMPNLLKAACSSNSLTTLDFTTNPELTEIACEMNQLTLLEVGGLANLEKLHCNDNQLTGLNLTGLISLKTFVAEINNITSLDFSGTPALEYVWCNKNNLTALDFLGLTNLWHITCSDNEGLQSLQLSGCTALEELLCNGTAITAIDFTGLESLTNIAAYDAALTSVTVTDSPNLVHLWVHDNALTQITLENLPLLLGLELRNNLLTGIDVSECSELSSFNIQDNPITWLNLANGEGSTFPVGHTFTEDQVVDVCVDGAELEYYEGLFTGYPNVVVDDCTMGADITQRSVVGLHPNPSNSIITVTSGETINQVSLLDINGRIIKILPCNDTTIIIDIMAQAVGIYFLKIDSANGSVIKRIIKK